MATWLWVSVGGAAGSLARYGTGRWAQHALPLSFPVGVLLVNALGSFLMGLLTVVLVERPVSEALRQGLLTGLLGGFTTYSAFNQDTFALLHRGSAGLAAFHVATTVGLCLGLGGLGHVVGRWLVA